MRKSQDGVTGGAHDAGHSTDRLQCSPQPQPSPAMTMLPCFPFPCVTSVVQRKARASQDVHFTGKTRDGPRSWMVSVLVPYVAPQIPVPRHIFSSGAARRGHVGGAGILGRRLLCVLWASGVRAWRSRDASASAGARGRQHCITVQHCLPCPAVATVQPMAAGWRARDKDQNTLLWPI